MRSLMFVGAAALMLLLAAAPARADWCGQSMEGTTTCGFETQQQCRAAMTGLGGTCTFHGGAQPQQPVQAAPAAVPQPPRKPPDPKKKPAQ